MLFTRWRVFHTWKNQKKLESHSHRNVHDENPYAKNMESDCTENAWQKPIYNEMVVIRTEMCTEENRFKKRPASSCTFVEWLPFLFEWIFIIHISVRMTTISFWMDFRHAHFCTNDYHLFLNGLSSCTFLYKLLPFLFEWIFHVCNALQSVNSMVQWRIINDIIMYIGFDHVINAL